MKIAVLLLCGMFNTRKECKDMLMVGCFCLKKCDDEMYLLDPAQTLEKPVDKRG